jgi:hypothetical protein
VGQTNDDVADIEKLQYEKPCMSFVYALKFSTLKWAECVIAVMDAMGETRIPC